MNDNDAADLEIRPMTIAEARMSAVISLALGAAIIAAIYYGVPALYDLLARVIP